MRILVDIDSMKNILSIINRIIIIIIIILNSFMFVNVPGKIFFNNCGNTAWILQRMDVVIDATSFFLNNDDHVQALTLIWL